MTPTIDWVLSLLREAHGPLAERPHLPPIAELVQTILSQNTSDRNSGRAYSNLASYYPTWKDVAMAEEHEIAESIRSGGLARIKSFRIKLILNKIMQERADMDLNFLRELPLDEAKAWLRQLPGVGPKTAACVLLFSLDMPAMPVDTHVFRLARRLGLVADGISAEGAHEALESMLGPEQVYPFHMYLIQHGRRVCKAGKPLCHRCVLVEKCPSVFNQS